MTTDDEPRPETRLDTPNPVFEMSQPDGTTVTLDFTTVGPFGDFAFAASVPAADGTDRERTYGAYHTQEPLIFLQILQHWARVAEPADILTGLEDADVALRRLTEGLEPTTQSENDFRFLLRRHVEPLAVMDFLPTDHEHADAGVAASSSRHDASTWPGSVNANPARHSPSLPASSGRSWPA